MNLFPLPLLYEDEELLVVDKPPGLRVIQDGYRPDLPSVRSILDSHYGKVFIVHRLDKDTSGLLIVARSPSSHKFLNDQFNLRSVEKEYHAVVISHESFPPRLSVNQPLRVNGDRRHRTIVDGKAGKPAETHFELLESFGNITLVRAIPKTGYTHQIRAHALFAGFPLLGDPLYGQKLTSLSENLNLPLFPRTALHAYKITFMHPRSHEPITFTSPYPADLASLLDQLRNSAGVDLTG